MNDENSIAGPNYHLQLKVASSSEYVDFFTYNSIPFEWQYDEDEWVPFSISTGYESYNADDGKAQVGFIGQLQNHVQWGGLMGPYYVP